MDQSNAPTSIPSSSPSSNDKIMAALAHVSAMMPMIGVIAPIVIWATQKDKSEFVAFQAIQAVAYQLLMVFLYFVGMGCYMGSFFLMFPAGILSSGSDVNPGALLFFVPFLVFGCILLGGFFFVIYGIVAAILTFQGRDFRYVFLGNWIANYLSKNK